MVLTLYKLDTSPPARAALMVIDLLGLEANLVDVNIFEGAHLTQEFVAKNPQHTIPMLEDDDFCIWDSHAIAAYLVGKYSSDDSLYPKDLKKRALVDQRLHFDSGILFPALRGTAETIIWKGQTCIPEECIIAINKAYELIEALLSSSRPWLTGENFTIADICCIANITSLDVIVPIDRAKYPNLATWMNKCLEIPSIQKINMPGTEKLRSMIMSKLE